MDATIQKRSIETKMLNEETCSKCGKPFQTPLIVRLITEKVYCEECRGKNGIRE